MCGSEKNQFIEFFELCALFKQCARFESPDNKQSILFETLSKSALRTTHTQKGDTVHMVLPQTYTLLTIYCAKYNRNYKNYYYYCFWLIINISAKALTGVRLQN